MSIKKLSIILTILVIGTAIAVAIVTMMKKETSTGALLPLPTPPKTVIFPYDEEGPSLSQENTTLSSGAETTNNEVQQEKEDAEEVVDLYQDSDSDGIPDWEELLKGTYTKQTVTKETSSTPSSSSTGTNFNTTSSSQTSSPSPLFTQAPLETTQTTSTPAQKHPLVLYANSVAAALASIPGEEEAVIMSTSLIQLPEGQTLLDTIKKQAGLSSAEAAAIAPFLPVPASKEQGAKNLSSLGAMYSEAEAVLKNVVAPENARTLHGTLTRAFESRAKLLSQLSKEKAAGDLKYSTLSSFNQNSKDIVATLGKIGALLKENNISFSSSDTGIVFMAYYQ